MELVFNILNTTQFILFCILLLIFSLQIFYMLLGIFPIKKYPEASKNYKYGVLIAARNEATVIVQLIDSIKRQDYPSELVDVFVVADNCTDNTAELARRAGATVYERFNTHKRGKSYALDFLLNKIFKNHPDDYKGFLFFDADNLLTKNYIHEMNKAVDSGLRIVTSYRNSKNFGTNWITSGYALCFLRECRFIHRSRQRLGSSTFVNGCGFYAEAEIFRNEKGWRYNLMTEDMEFSIAQVLKGERIGYAEDAEFYDEQPETFIQSWHQRMRWIRGSYLTFWKYGIRLIKGTFGKHGYAKLDLMLFLVPMPFVAEVCLFANILLHLGYGLFMLDTNARILIAVVQSIFWFSINTCMYVYLTCAWVMLLEWKRIKLSPVQKIRHMFLAPLFVSTYILIIVAAMFYKVGWTPIRRNSTITIAELEESQEASTTRRNAKAEAVSYSPRDELASPKVSSAPSLMGDTSKASARAMDQVCANDDAAFSART